jgi:hypothetical protein
MQIYLSKGRLSMDQKPTKTAEWSVVLRNEDGTPCRVLGEIALKHEPEFRTVGDYLFRLDGTSVGVTTDEALTFVKAAMRVVGKCDRIEREDGIIIMTPVKKGVDTKV